MKNIVVVPYDAPNRCFRNPRKACSFGSKCRRVSYTALMDSSGGGNSGIATASLQLSSSRSTKKRGNMARPRPSSASCLSAKSLLQRIVVGMVTGLRSPDRILVDQMRTWNASRGQTLRALRWPAALPYLFASLKVAAAASLVGAIIGELPTGAVAGLGARMLSGSYYGQTIQIWAALMMAAILAAALVGVIGVVERVTYAAMGGRR